MVGVKVVFDTDLEGTTKDHFLLELRLLLQEHYTCDIVSVRVYLAPPTKKEVKCRS